MLFRFGETVPMMEVASRLVGEVDVLIVIGTSLQDYPDANLIHHTKTSCEVYLIDPNVNNMRASTRISLIAEKASKRVLKLIEMLTK